MRRPRRRLTGAEQIGRDDAVIGPKRVTEGRPLLVARTAAVDRDNRSSGAPDGILDRKARADGTLRSTLRFVHVDMCRRRNENVRDDPANCLQS